MTKIIVGFSRAKSLLSIGSKVIQLTEKRNYSHVFIKYTCPITKVSLIAQASHGFINQQNYDIFLKTNIVVEEYEYNISHSKFSTFLNYINNNLGKPYSYLQLILLSIKKLFKFEINIHNKDDAFICSEFGAKILETLDILNTKNEDYITPSDLNKLIKRK